MDVLQRGSDKITFKVDVPVDETGEGVKLLVETFVEYHVNSTSCGLGLFLVCFVDNPIITTGAFVYLFSIKNFSWIGCGIICWMP